LHDGKVVTSVLADRSGPLLVGWGGVADLVMEQRTGQKLSASALPLADLSYPVPHGWLDEIHNTGNDALRADRWLLAAALLSGLIEGALELTTEHVLSREQFGKPLAAFQGVQLPLAELKVWCDGVRLSVLDTAGLKDRGDEQWGLSAAFTWLAAVRAAERATKVCHQSFGALGFCNETGLVQLTWSMSWLRLSVGVESAQESVLASRSSFLDEHQASEPGCLVLEGSAKP
jgi:alkylation response protein AidB-like acyl-CoA dehydrogenase